MIQFQFFPKTNKIPAFLNSMISGVFEKNYNSINSEQYTHESNKVLEILRDDFEKTGYIVEKDRTDSGKIKIPVLFGLNNTMEKSFDADAFNSQYKTVVEVEAGRGYTNYQFLKDFFEALVMNDIDYSVIAVRNIYRNSNDFDKVVKFFNTIYTSDRFISPLKGLLVIGY